MQLYARIGPAALAAAMTFGIAQGAAAAPVDLPIAVQLYSLRNAGAIEEQLAAVERAGIRYVETYRPLGDTGAEASDFLGDFGLSAISAHVGIDQLRNDLDAVIEYNLAIGNDTVVLPSLFRDLPQDADGWAAIGAELGDIAERLDAAGLNFAFHNHAPAMQEFDGLTGMEILLEAGGPLVKGQLDLAWAYLGGQDPAAILNRLAGRLISVHAKDVALEAGPTVGGRPGAMFAAVGEGVLDWDAILNAAQTAGVGWYILEHDNPPDAEEVLRIGNQFLTERLTQTIDQPAPIPLPAGLPLLAGGILAIGLLRRRRG